MKKVNDENIVKKIIGISKNYEIVNPNDFKVGHGGGLSVKVVLPGYCQAHCPFCFNNLTLSTQKHDYEMFFKNLIESLDMIFNNINNRPISIDITGNEPTFYIEIFSRLMKIISKYKSKIDKVVLTSNGFNLEKCLIHMKNVVDIVNISVHHYDYDIRKMIFKTASIPNDNDLKRVINTLEKYNISSTAVSVLYKEFEIFKDFYHKFMNWAKELGFKDIRMRSNFCADDKFINDIIDTKFECEKLNSVNGLTTKIITDKESGFETYILKGVPDLTEYVIGAELVIDDDGLCYVDYNKRYLVNKSNINYFNYFYVYK